MRNILTDFEKFAKSQPGMSTSALRDFINKGVPSNYISPSVLEERKLNVTQLDVYSRLLLDRIVYFGDSFTSDTCNVLVAQLLYLSSISEDDIHIYINSPGGSVIDGLSVIDTMNFIKNDVATTCVGMAASMGAVLLSNGTKGKRIVLPHSRVMIHQVSDAIRGTFSDMKIEFEQTERCKKDIYNILSKNIGKSYEEIEQLCDRNNWFVGQEAVDLGIADKVLF